jgi:hypothetical protein
MRIRPLNLLFAAGGYLVGSGQANQLWRKAREWMEDRAARTNFESAGSDPTMPRTPFSAEPAMPVSPVESFSP